MTSVAVAVTGVPGGASGKGSRRAVKWAVENLLPETDRFLLVHVMPRITSIPTPLGDRVPVTELDENVVALYMHDIREKFEQIFIPFKQLCRTETVETLLLEDDNPVSALLQYMSESGFKSLVMGSCSSNCITWRLKRPRVPETVLRYAPGTYDIYVISRDNKINRRSANTSFTSEANSRQYLVGSDYRGSKKGKKTQLSDSVESEFHETTIASKGIHDYIGDNKEINNIEQLNFNTKQAKFWGISKDSGDEQDEMESLQLELENTVYMYKRACEELVHAQNQVRSVSSECLEDTRRVNAALEREETLRKVVDEEKAKHLEAKKALEEAKKLLAKEAYERQAAELNALKESLEKQKIVDALISGDRRYRRYTRDEIKTATNCFSETNVIGEGGYGKVYKCSLNHTPVAVKVLHQHDVFEKKDEFLKEVEVLSQIRHPNVVLLLGACPEIGCLVYEYLENGSLEDYILHQHQKPPLPWFIRFRIVFQVACGLAFLHNSNPEPIIHRDLKPGNILLDRNYVSKISDVGLAKIIGEIVPDNVSEYRNSMLAGTLHYMDPEYLRTGTVRPKSDLYAFGVVILQLLAGRYPNGLLLDVENAVARGSVEDVLDKSITDWPLIETEELAQLALKCTKLRCRDRPDLDTEVMPVLKRLVDFADANQKNDKNPAYAPSHFICPILQEIMDDPHIAADGFTYEYSAIKAWLDKHNVSPVTKLRLKHSMLTPNHTLRSAIQEWSSKL